MEEQQSRALVSNRHLGEVAAVFLRLGSTAFGGPAAHIAMMEEEVVRRRRWVSREEFLDLLGASNLIPGPNSTELAIHLGYRRAGWPGLIAAGVCFILPATAIVLLLAAAYRRFGALPDVAWLLYGIKPVILAIVAQALWRLGQTALKAWPAAVGAATALAGSLVGWDEIGLLLAVGVGVMLLRARLPGAATALLPAWPGAVLGTAGLAAPGMLPVAALGQTGTPTALFLFFLKVGSVLYGSGYVLLAFLQGGPVSALGWLTPQELLDAVAVGQFTPGPLFTTATFVGYLVAGLPGALTATAGIFLPAFLFVAGLSPLLVRVRQSRWLAGFLDGVNAASLGLMAAVTWQLGAAAMVDWLAAALGVAALAVLIRWRVHSAWLVLAGGALGWASRFVG